MTTLHTFIMPIDGSEFGMYYIDLNVVQKSFSVNLEFKKETSSNFERGQTILTLTIDEVIFSTTNQTELNNNTYILHHVNETENKAYLNLISKRLNTI